MKVLLVSHFFPPTFTAGTETYTLALAKALSQRGHSVQVVCAEGWETGARHWNGTTEDIFEGVPVTRVHLNWMKAADPNKALYDNEDVERWFTGYLQANNPDLVHVTSAISLGVGILRAVRHAGVPLVLTLTDFWFLCPRIQLLRSDGALCDGLTSSWECQRCLCGDSRAFHMINHLVPEKAQPAFWQRASHIRILSRRRGFRGMVLNMEERKQVLQEHLNMPDRVLSPSMFLREMFEGAGARIPDLIRHGHNLSWRSAYERTAPASGLRFGFVGQIDRIKGVHLLVEAARALEREDAFSVDIWGDLGRSPDYVKGLRELAGGDERIRFRGRCLRSELGRVLSGIDVLVVPSIWYENAPLAIQEAFAVGIPVIATDLGGMREVVTHDVNGLLFDRGSAADLARQMRRLLLDPALLERLRSAIPEVRTSEEEVTEIEALYVQLTSARLQHEAIGVQNSL